jgi:hypothetical protein
VRNERGAMQCVCGRTSVRRPRHSARFAAAQASLSCLLIRALRDGVPYWTTAQSRVLALLGMPRLQQRQRNVRGAQAPASRVEPDSVAQEMAPSLFHVLVQLDGRLLPQHPAHALGQPRHACHAPLAPFALVLRRSLCRVRQDTSRLVSAVPARLVRLGATQRGMALLIAARALRASFQRLMVLQAARGAHPAVVIL